MTTLWRAALTTLFVLTFLNLESFSQTPVSAHPQYRIPEKGKINVAFVLSKDAVTIDFAGPWEVFKDVFVPERGKSMAEQSLYRLYTVSDSREPVTTSGGMKIVPDFTFEDAPSPQIVVVPAQQGRSKAMLSWLRQRATESDVVMSVCTGAEVLGDAGLLNGKPATTHHMFYDEFRAAFPATLLQTNKRFVQSDPVIFTSAGLSAGIDLALHIVELYVGRERAEATAGILEYEGQGWKDPSKAFIP